LDHPHNLHFVRCLDEEHEITQVEEADKDTSAIEQKATPPRTIRARKSFAKDLERVEMRITPSDAWTDCGGSFEKLGTDVMEELETA
jgi:hypothetical protein